MADFSLETLGRRVRAARATLKLTQAALGKAIGLERSLLSRLESGEYTPDLDVAVQLAAKLKVPLEWLTSGRLRPPSAGVSAIALELYRLGVRDLVVPNSHVPGAIRRDEEVLVLAVSGDRPNPRVVEAIPFVLTRVSCRWSVVATYAVLHDRRARTRLGWLADIAHALTRHDDFPAVKSPKTIESLAYRFAGLVAAESPTTPDTLGHPDGTNLPPIWRRWNVNYAGRPADFLRRAIELAEAVRNNPVVPEGGE